MDRKSLVRAAVLPVVWLALYAIGYLMLPEAFGSPRNIETIIRQTIIVGFASIGMTFVIAAAMIDLSVGSAVALVTVAVATALKAGWSPGMAALAGIVAAIAVGAFNGLLVTRLKVGAFVVTLASLLAVRGTAKGIAHETKIDANLTWLNDLTAALNAKTSWMLLPIGGWLVIVFAILGALILHRTVFGRNVIAIGSNPEAAHLSGISVSRVQLGVYLLAGIFVGMAGVSQFARLSVGDPTVAEGLELNVIAAVVIGGASLSGGSGSIFGSLIGALIMTTINTIGSQAGWPTWIQAIVTAVIILVAVGLDRLRSSRTSG
ncbi:MAG: ABC transporter permease [Fimbriimonadaceae bacterium]